VGSLLPFVRRVLSVLGGVAGFECLLLFVRRVPFGERSCRLGWEPTPVRPAGPVGDRWRRLGWEPTLVRPAGSVGSWSRRGARVPGPGESGGFALCAGWVQPARGLAAYSRSLGDSRWLRTRLCAEDWLPAHAWVGGPVCMEPNPPSQPGLHGGSGGRSPAGRGPGGLAPRKHRRRIPAKPPPGGEQGTPMRRPPGRRGGRLRPGGLNPAGGWGDQPGARLTRLRLSILGE
jgi:hypothetical protein